MSVFEGLHFWSICKKILLRYSRNDMDWYAFTCSDTAWYGLDMFRHVLKSLYILTPTLVLQVLLMSFLVLVTVTLAHSVSKTVSQDSWIWVSYPRFSHSSSSPVCLPSLSSSSSSSSSARPCLCLLLLVLLTLLLSSSSSFLSLFLMKASMTLRILEPSSKYYLC